MTATFGFLVFWVGVRISSQVEIGFRELSPVVFCWFFVEIPELATKAVSWLSTQLHWRVQFGAQALEAAKSYLSQVRQFTAHSSQLLRRSCSHKSFGL